MQFSKKLKTILQSNKFFLFLAFFLSIWVGYNFLFVYNNSKYNVLDTVIKGVILDINIDGDRLKMNVNGKEEIVCFYTFLSEDEKNTFSFKLGDIVYLEGEIKEVTKASNPYVFDYYSYLKNKQIHYLFQIEKMKVIEENSNFFLFIKQKIIDRIEKIEGAREYLYAFLLGNTSYFSSSKLKMYQNLGVSHLFAISGMHVSFIISILSRNKKTSKKVDFLIFSFLLFYLILLNFKSSAFLSIIFYILKKLSHLMNLSYSNIHIFFLTLFLLLLFFPFSFLEQSFIYSFCLRVGLLFFFRGKNSNFLFSNFLLSLFSFIITIPLNIFFSSGINFGSIFFNLFFVPFVTYLVFPFSIIVFFFPFLSSILNSFIYLMEGVGEAFLSIPSLVYFMKPSLLVIFLLFFLLILANRGKVFMYIFVFCLFIIKIYPAFSCDYLLMIDVGEADSILLHSDGKNILIDTGGSFSYPKEKWQKRKNTYSVTDSILLPIFHSLGISKLDVVFLSHGDYDHMGEAINLVENFKVEKVIFNCGDYNELEKELIDVLNDKEIPYYSCIKELTINSNKLYLLNNGIYDNENDNSSVIYTRINNYKFLFMGDAGVEVEKDILKKYNLKDIDVLKVGHHGSKTSSSKEFIDEISPKYSVISVGKNNRYAHPNKEVLENLKKSKIYRTDLDGSILFKIKNNRLEIETFTS